MTVNAEIPKDEVETQETFINETWTTQWGHIKLLGFVATEDNGFKLSFSPRLTGIPKGPFDSKSFLVQYSPEREHAMEDIKTKIFGILDAAGIISATGEMVQSYIINALRTDKFTISPQEDSAPTEG